MTLGDGYLVEYSDPPNCERLPKGSSIPQRMLEGELAAALLGEDMLLPIRPPPSSQP
jgi:4,5-dihydroxyphthalate decarboxylase